jgi:hypothetical protein
MSRVFLKNTPKNGCLKLNPLQFEETQFFGFLIRRSVLWLRKKGDTERVGRDRAARGK